MNASAKSIQDTSIHGKKWTENIVRRLTLYEDPIPVDFPHLIAPEKHQVGQDQHGGGARCKSSMEPPESSRGEELALSGGESKRPLVTRRKHRAETRSSLSLLPAQDASHQGLSYLVI